mmetsp:Transcript_13530/g.23038  ORF Transcript_13530/g.23038 Transcript_13530/m.23038 type:complete len:210 (+) Transcript_13530:225-854(+)|eukprot:CAMPEP_0183743804 /NCGR_PEP_ID=MMETSP0737-20130205/65405_1 /TAXON_ID=385413 /ORGANISM="Thalassiosira miniscula, Strain CCMP1093" /LENGTH=209 /DNA_ID=CAMNT_0025979433 /DNA_START=227 /DNA_END=856 /DNA_ORIENTATION=+
MNMPNLFLLTIAVLATVATGFAPATSSTRRTTTSLSIFGRGAAATPTKQSTSSPLLEEALSIYPYQFRPEGEAKSGTKSTCTAAFNELARLYGDEAALAMVKIEPNTLKFKSQYFERSLDAWTEQFGLESAQAMVLRNPGLLCIPPWQAEQPSESCMALSYVVAATRPLPKILAVGLVLSVLGAGFFPEAIDSIGTSIQSFKDAKGIIS